MQLTSQPITWQQHNTLNHTNSAQELQLFVTQDGVKNEKHPASGISVNGNTLFCECPDWINLSAKNRSLRLQWVQVHQLWTVHLSDDQPFTVLFCQIFEECHYGFKS